MDVRCEKCRTEYEFEDSKIGENGVTVKCTVCNHVFKVKKKALVVTEPIKEEARESAAAAATPLSATPLAAPAASGAAPEKAREWKVRQANGNVFTFKELTTLQKWIVERKVARDDEISLTGESWKRLGNIAELASFFQVVEAADRATSAAAAYGAPYTGVGGPVMQPPQAGYTGTYPGFSTNPNLAMPTAARMTPGNGSPIAPEAMMSAPPVAEAAPAYAPAPQPAYTAPAAAPAAPAATPQPRAAESSAPAPASTPAPAPKHVVEVDDEELAASIKGGGNLKWALLGIAVALIGVVIVFALRQPAEDPLPAPAAAQQAEPPAPAAPSPAPPAAPPEPAQQAAAQPTPPADPAAAAPATAPATAPAAAVPATAPAAAAPAPAQPAVAEPGAGAEPVPAKAAAPGGTPEGKPFEWYLAQAMRRREREQPDQALKLYEKAAELQPDDPEVLVGIGYCHFDLRSYSDAVASFQRALKVSPRFRDAMIGSAESYREMGNKAKAIEFYKKYLDEAPDGPEADLARANIERLGKE